MARAGLLTVTALFPLATSVSIPALDSNPIIVRSTQFAAAQKCPEAQRELAAIPDSAREADQARYAVAECYVKQAQWNQAEPILQPLLRRSPAYTPALFLQAYLLFRTRRYDESLSLISNYLELTPENGEAHKIRGLDYFMLSQTREAEQEMKRAAELNSSDSDAYYYLGRLYFTRKDMLAALETFRRTIELNPTSVKAYNQLGQTYEGLAEFAPARQAYLKAIEIEQRQREKSQWPYYNLGLLCLREGRSQEAIDYLRQSELRNPKWADAKVKLAMALLDAGKTEEASAKLREAIAIDPGNADVHYQLGRVLSKMGKKEEARQHFFLFRRLEKR